MSADASQLSVGIATGLLGNVVWLAVTKYVDKLSVREDVKKPDILLSNIPFNLLIVGIVSGLMGATGHFFGRIVEQHFLETSPYLGRFFNDFSRVLLWNFGIVLMYSYLFLQDDVHRILKKDYLRISGALLGIALVCGLLFPLLNLLAFGSFTARSLANNGYLASVFWFVCAGAIFGCLSAAAWGFVLHNNKALLPIVLSTIFAIFYGIVLASLIYVIGGMGVNDSQTLTDTKLVVAVVVLGLLPFALAVAVILSRNSITSALTLFVTTILLGLVLGTLLAGLTEFSTTVRQLLVNQFSETGIAVSITYTFLLITNVPWGICVCAGLILQKTDIHNGNHCPNQNSPSIQ